MDLLARLRCQVSHHLLLVVELGVPILRGGPPYARVAIVGEWAFLQRLALTVVEGLLAGLVCLTRDPIMEDHRVEYPPELRSYGGFAPHHVAIAACMLLPIHQQRR